MDIKRELKELLKQFAAYVPKRYENAGDPDANDDDSDTGGNGIFKSGDIWINTTDKGIFICVDASTGAADWDEMAKV